MIGNQKDNLQIVEDKGPIKILTIGGNKRLIVRYVPTYHITFQVLNNSFKRNAVNFDNNRCIILDNEKNSLIATIYMSTN